MDFPDDELLPALKVNFSVDSHHNSVVSSASEFDEKRETKSGIVLSQTVSFGRQVVQAFCPY